MHSRKQARRVRLGRLTSRRKAIAELAKLGEETSKFSARDCAELDRGLADSLWEAGDLEQAKAKAMLACQSDRSNLGPPALAV